MPTRSLLLVALGLSLFTAAAPVPARALATSSATSAASPRAGILYFDGRARTMRTLYSTSTTNQAQSPRVWSCLCFMNNDIQLATDSEFGQVYLTRAEPGSHNPWNTAAPTNAAAAQLSTVRESYGLGNTYWYGIAFKLDSSWSQPDWATLVTVGYPTLSSGPIDIDVYPINGSLSYILYMNSGLLTANTSGFFKGSVFSHTQIAPVVSGKWVEIILGIKWATNNTGSVNAYYRLEGQHSWKHPISKTHLATAQYGATSYGTVGPDGKNSDGSKRSVLDKQGLYYGFWSSATTSFATRSVYESGLTRSSSFARAASTLP